MRRDEILRERTGQITLSEQNLAALPLRAPAASEPQVMSGLDGPYSHEVFCAACLPRADVGKDERRLWRCLTALGRPDGGPELWKFSDGIRHKLLVLYCV